MGRRPPAARSKQKAQTAEIVNPSIGGAGTPSEGTNPPLGQAELQPENTNQTLGGLEVQPKKQANSGNLSLNRKGRYSSDVAVRRSARLQDVVPVHLQEIERLIDEVALSESEKEDELPTDEETEINQSDSTMRDTNLGEKIDYLVRLLKEQRKTIKTLELLATKRSMSGEIPCSSQTRYKNLYFKSQKKVEALTEENHQLALKLEIAVAKLEGYEKGIRANSDMMEKLKDVILVSNLTQAAQNAVNTLQGKARVTSAKTRNIREIKKK
ncbi:hypothetical protein LWI28_012748 [Acer negundo]|uniref:Uncharacterized protein n=1 Tax=Acer negundo TaxID=4023 RepID=A0AAD5NTU6_ACENE|nr:hypothetical protein LWI28_012748 [Acer negundo]KAK4849295.1 hypothetical protein QYF36_023253 [Acer negundo]